MSRSRSLANRVGAYAVHKLYDSRDLTRNGRARFLQTFLDQVDRDSPGLPEDERQRRAAMARKEHFARLALASAKARRVKAERKASVKGAAPTSP